MLCYVTGSESHIKYEYSLRKLTQFLYCVFLSDVMGYHTTYVVNPGDSATVIS